jgi:r-opsin
MILYMILPYIYRRYLVISRPLDGDDDYKMLPTPRWACFVSLSTWLYSAVFATLPLFGVGKYVPEGYLTSCSFDYLSNDLTTKIFILVYFVAAWVVPLTIAVVSYVSIIRAVSYVRRNVSEEILSPNTEGITHRKSIPRITLIYNCYP